ncbi:MAG: hypothetical protein IBJ00_02935 [Alphaproteobacteria bacterium]|nr:hypothetical protein [Alphaproteobacteria bacterium]
MTNKKELTQIKKDQENASNEASLTFAQPQSSTRGNLVALRAQKRKESLAKALRENLLKRKAQMRQRHAQKNDDLET